MLNEHQPLLEGSQIWNLNGTSLANWNEDLVQHTFSLWGSTTHRHQFVQHTFSIWGLTTHRHQFKNPEFAAIQIDQFVMCRDLYHQ